MSGNRLAAIPREITKLPLLTAVYLSRNFIREVGSDVGRMLGLEKLDLMMNRISRISTAVTRLGDLIELDLSANELDDISVLSGLRKLHLLSARYNYITTVREGGGAQPRWLIVVG